MKVIFVFSLLINIVFFLWEFNVRSVDPLPVVNNSSEKQILLVSELPMVVASNKALEPFTKELLVVGNEVQHIEETQQSETLEIKVELPATLEPAEINKSAVIEKSEQTLPTEIVTTPVIAKKSVEKKVTILPVVKKVELIPVLAGVEKQVCHQVGPFKHKNALEAWANLNTIKIKALKPYEQDSKVVSSYLVYYPAADNYQQGKANVAMLKQKGIKDLWLFRKGDLRGGVSLGLFVKESRALAMREKLLNKGINVDVIRRYKTISMWYVKLLADRKSLTMYDDLLISECEKM